ncbi:hypothetical protein PF005_g27207 [Phytophthora fragariae]|uniref:Uncharacterized protein n=1 Tax=Phytophthora fragariae TaxID=53985 RepID=A0A6A3HF04_9STRA|nr:hypothetical protein PF009_g27861 [Phytophthora fragariae]KAE8967198.1 hypothetical protein PF011_g27641 [Phytophthora fragariae]KAE9069760.1 hypothetical protein PF007_g27194 [Phytophthora fragariae]KAE9171283.1 hypothetical protein PF005_g27207 [Phytophthora fragariae]KAE9176024.1 hypothetical protein PF004_g26212 [Phytophthora fragariae]
MIVPSSSLELESIFSRRERATFIRESARVLFLTEYLVLVEYVEVVLPIVYCAHHAIVYNLHNRAYSSSCVSGCASRRPTTPSSGKCLLETREAAACGLHLKYV